MSEGKLNGHLSTTSLSVVWTTKEVEDKNNNNQHHQNSRCHQFFTTSCSVLSPFLTPSSHQLYLWSGYTALEDFLRELEAEEIVFRNQLDGSEFRAFYAKDRLKKRTAASRGNPMDEVKKWLMARYDGNAEDDFDVKCIARFDVEELKDKSKFWKRNQYKKEVNLNSEEPTFLAEGFVKSRFDHPNIITPDAFVLDGPELYSGKKCRSLFRITPLHGVGNLEKFADFLSGTSADLRELILSQIIKGALEGLEHIHQRGFVYDNFDPSNIIVCEDQDPKSLTGLTGKLIGFSRSCKTARSKLGTSTHERRELKHVIDPSVDLWALGSCLFFLFTRKPFRDSTKLNHPWSDDDDRRLKESPFPIRPWLFGLIKDLLVNSKNINPNKRLKCTVPNVRNSQWITSCGDLYSSNVKSAPSTPAPDIKNEISKIIEMVKNGVPKDSTINPGTSCDEECQTEFENLETQLSNETSYQSSGSPKSLVGNNSSASKIGKSATFNEAEIGSGQLNFSNSFHSTEVNRKPFSSSHRPSLTPLVPSRAISNTGVQSRSSFNSSAPSAVSKTSDDVSVSRNPLENKYSRRLPTNDEFEQMIRHATINFDRINKCRDFYSTSDARELNVSASTVNRRSTAVKRKPFSSSRRPLTTLDDPSRANSNSGVQSTSNLRR